jgi:hypothetical protein
MYVSRKMWEELVVRRIRNLIKQIIRNSFLARKIADQLTSTTERFHQ